MRKQPNVNALFCALLVEELARQGTRDFVIAPGSRCTPLVVAAVRNRRLRCFPCTDERAAAFMALGIARASGRPAAVIVTSGTAVANLLPAVVEASVDRVPLLLLTADRPPELRECGANQTIRQDSLLAEPLRWRLELPVPDDSLPARLVLTTAAHAYARALADAGPVQLNCPFREPLAPREEPWNVECLAGTEAWQRNQRPFTVLQHAAARADAACLDAVAGELGRHEHGLVVAAGHASAPAALDLAAALGWPLWADSRSGLRLGNEHPCHLPHLDLLMNAGSWRPRAVLQIGGRPVSRPLQETLDALAPDTFICVDAGPDRLDPGHRVTQRVRANPEHFCLQVAQRLGGGQRSPPAPLSRTHERIEALLSAALDEDGPLSEPFVARWLSRHAPAEHRLFISSSMPIRDLQRFAVRDGPPLALAANRGASGIDGVLASAAGYAVGGDGPVTLLIGDLALLHDLGSLTLLSRLGQPLVVVLLNNGGGGIFGLLPIAAHADVFTPWFDTPHDFRFSGTAADLGIAYRAAVDRDGFVAAYQEAVQRPGPTLLELQLDRHSNRLLHEQLGTAMREACTSG